MQWKVLWPVQDTGDMISKMLEKMINNFFKKMLNVTKKEINNKLQNIIFRYDEVIKF